MKLNFKKYWFEFDIENAFIFPPGINIGCGVTAFNYEDAIEIITKKIFTEVEIPLIKRVIENVDIDDLDRGHVIPNMKTLVNRGVWFPIGYE